MINSCGFLQDEVTYNGPIYPYSTKHRTTATTSICSLRPSVKRSMVALLYEGFTARKHITSTNRKIAESYTSLFTVKNVKPCNQYQQVTGSGQASLFQYSFLYSFPYSFPYSSPYSCHYAYPEKKDHIIQMHPSQSDS